MLTACMKGGVEDALGLCRACRSENYVFGGSVTLLSALALLGRLLRGLALLGRLVRGLLSASTGISKSGVAATSMWNDMRCGAERCSGAVEATRTRGEGGHSRRRR